MFMYYNYVGFYRNWNIGFWGDGFEYFWSYILGIGYERNCVFGFYVIYNV